MEQGTEIAYQSRHTAVVPCIAILLLLFVLRIDILMAENPRYPISSADVAQALIGYGLRVSPEDVRLPALLSARGPSPQLELASIRPVAAGLMQLELRCHSAGECLPFFVLLNVPPGAAAVLTADVKKRQLADIPGAPPSVAEQLSLKASRAPSKMRAGTHVTLLLEDGQMRIQLPAVALDSGAPGFDVRVCTPDHRKTFRATVVDPVVAKGGVQ